jgi:hypothetical protein
VEAIALRRRLTDLESELITVVRDAKRAKNQQRRIELNIEARTLRAQIGHVRGNLYSTDDHHGIA